VNRPASLVAATSLLSVIACGAPAWADVVRDNQWHLEFLHVQEAHKLALGDGVTVAIIDTGVDRHRDLASNLLPGVNLVPGQTNDGRADPDGHGTAMAGLVAAHGRGGDGALGLAPHSKLLPVAVDMVSMSGSNETAAEGIRWATDHGADVINVSAGGSPSTALRAAVDHALQENVIVVAAAGNRPSSTLGFPALYPGVVAVGATDRQGKIAPLSVTGPGVVIVAPGTDIHSTSNNGLYQRGDGTSDAAAIVSGAVALVRSRFPNLSAAEVVRRLTATATDKGAPGRDDQYGYGVLNLVAALTADLPPPSEAAPSETAAAAAPRKPDGGAPVVGLVALGVVGVVIAGFVLHVRARRHRVRRGSVP
jgi:type VII secretion-associated serine protease mycosin